MRHILVKNARRKQSLKYGGGRGRIGLEEALPSKDDDTPAEDLIALDEALEKLSRKDQIKADLVKLRCFVGLTAEQAVKVLGISPSTADRYWAYARSWQRLEISKGDQITRG